MKISMIAAVAENGVIGKDNDLVWKLPDDMKYFMDTTKGHVVLMGRKNWESIPEKYRPLPNRTNIVISRNTEYNLPEGVLLVQTLEEAIQIGKDRGETEFMVIGGEQIYKLALPVANRLYITEVNASPEGDSFFPEFNRAQWREVSRTHHTADEKHKYSFDFVIFDKISNDR